MGSSTKTTSESKPPEWALPAFQQSGSEASRLYNNGSGGNTWLGSTVAPLSGTTMSGLNQLADAGANWDTSGSRSLYQGIGAASAADPYAGQLGALGQTNAARNVNSSGLAALGGSNAAQNVGTESDYRTALTRAQGPSYAEQNLGNYASGANLQGDGNPFYRQRLESELADTAAQVRSSMSGAGRYGSDVSNNTLADALGKQRTAALENDWNREQQNQFNAVGMMDAGRQAGMGNQLAAISGITGVQTGNADRTLSGLGLQSDILSRAAGIDAGNADRQLSGLGLQGNMLSQAAGVQGANLNRALSATQGISDLDQRNFQNQLTGAGATLQAGGKLDSQNQALIMDEVNKFYSLDNQDWSRLGMLQGAAAGAAGPYGTQLQESRTSNPMAAIGALGSLAGGMKPSDRRLKENIRAVGKLDNGHIVYAYNYIAGGPTELGVMAQDVIETHPEAVLMEPDGFYAVNYDLAVKELETV